MKTPICYYRSIILLLSVLAIAMVAMADTDQATQSTRDTLAVLEDTDRYDTMTVWFPTLIKVNRDKIRDSEALAMDSITIKKTKGFSVYQGVVGPSSSMTTSKLFDRSDKIGNYATSLILGYETDSVLFRLLIQESSLGVGHRGMPRGYGHRVILEHEWYIKYIYDSSSSDQ